jgi:hypothetical protein
MREEKQIKKANVSKTLILQPGLVANYNIWEKFPDEVEVLTYLHTELSPS